MYASHYKKIIVQGTDVLSSSNGILRDLSQPLLIHHLFHYLSGNFFTCVYKYVHKFKLIYMSFGNFLITFLKTSVTDEKL